MIHTARSDDRMNHGRHSICEPNAGVDLMEWVSVSGNSDLF